MKAWLKSLGGLLTYFVAFYVFFVLLSFLARDLWIVYVGAIALSVVPWWPFSSHGRGFIARRRGRVYEALRRAELIGGSEGRREALKALRSSLPTHPVSDRVLEARRLLRNLEVVSYHADDDGVPRDLASHFDEQVDASGDALWRAADRIAAPRAARGRRRAAARRRTDEG